jgi:hypothetical protein
MIGKSRVNWRPDLFLSRIQFSVSFEASMPSAIPANAAIWRVALPSRVFALIAAALARVILAALALSLNLSRLKDLLCPRADV